MKSGWLFIPLVIAPFLTTGPTAAGSAATGEPLAATRRDTIPPDDILVADGAVIGEIYVRVENIFDPTAEDEDRHLFHIANRLHVTTRPRVVERKLLFASGDPYDPRLLMETERYLRSQNYLYDASVRPVRVRGNRVDVLVVTRDVWTLSFGVGLHRAGGANAFNVSLEDTNFLGTGRQLDVKYSDDPDRSSRRFRFVDSALFGTRAELRLWHASNSDGHRRIFDLERPFYALDARWAAGAWWLSDERQRKLYRLGEVAEHFQHRQTVAEIRGGRSRGLIDGRARRWRVGFTFERHRFSADEDTAHADAVPADRTLSYPWIGFERVEDGYIEARNMDRLVRTEDFNLGTELRGRLGWSSPAWGGDQDQAVFDLRLRSGWQPRPDQTLLLDGSAVGRWGADGYENLHLGGELRYFLRTFGRHRLQIALRVDAAWNPDPERQLLLGGDSGLRGYPRRFADGDRRVLLSIEQRFYTHWELFKLVHAGAAAFFDAGSAWYDGDGGPHVLRNVGLGLRLSSSRSARGAMVHLDVAYPLDGDSDKIQWLVTSRETF